MHLTLIFLITVTALVGEAFLSSIPLYGKGTMVNFEVEAPERACTREGIMCKDCNTLVSCKKTPDGASFDYDTVLLCPHYAPCDETKLGCSTDADPRCRYKKFECPPNNFTIEREFPDPYSCNQFHGCQNDDVFHYSCPNGYSFDMVKKDCSALMDGADCEKSPIPACMAAGDVQQIENTTYQYQCVEIVDEKIIYPVITYVEESDASFFDSNEM